MPDTLQSVLAVVVLIIGSMVGLTVADAVIESTSDTGADGSRLQKAQELQGTSFVRVNSLGSGTNETVVNSRGKALAFDGSTDATVQADADLNIHARENWSVSQASLGLNASATDENMTIVTEGDPNIYLRYAGNRTTAHWQVIYHTDGLQKSYVAEVEATDPTNTTFLFAQRNATTLFIYRNDTVGTAPIDGTSDATPALVNDSNLNGTLDETRMFGTNLSASQRTQLTDNPNDGITGVNHSARITYDEYLKNEGEVRVWWTSASASRGVGTGFVDGLPGEVLERKTVMNDIAGTSDYGWQNDGPRIRAVSGGQLDGSPVAYVTYDFVAGSANVIGAFGDMVSLVSFVGLIVVASLIISRLKNAS